ncbi:DUF6792 domain-containing protein [Hoeflea sp. TYP-13]|uniref:DUF6792 domain-containing protein n=1 Tax=Hoeflea sp. TYP-13 TaxID=3230023 RepID=UPI0034C6B7DC
MGHPAANLIGGLGIALAMAFLTGCQTSDTRKADSSKKNDANHVLLRPSSEKYVKTQDVEAGIHGAALKGVWQYGLLAAQSYDDNVSTDIHLRPQCDHPTKYARRWRRLPQFSDDGHTINNLPPGLKIPGFNYSVWRDMSRSAPDRVAIVLRGTNFTDWGDWYSNARWITRFNPLTVDQYQQTGTLVEQLVPELQRKFGPDVEIIAVGHSLGGGLAQHAGYASAGVTKVYAFASSPVVDHRSFGADKNEDNRQGMEIYRISESGEILAGSQWIHRNTAGLSTQNPKTTELLYSFRQGFYKRDTTGDDTISQHGVRQLSCDMVCHIEHGKSRNECTGQS